MGRGRGSRRRGWKRKIGSLRGRRREWGSSRREGGGGGVGGGRGGSG